MPAAVQVVVDWGDGSSDLVTVGQPLTHPYADPGSYTMTVTTLSGALVSTQPVVVKGHDPRAFAFLDGDDDWRSLLWIDEPADGTKYRVDWGDGSTPVTTQGHSHASPPPHPRLPHDYTAVGEYTITVTDTASRRSSAVPTAAGQIGVLFTFVAGRPDQPGVTAQWLATGAVWTVDWGDGSAPMTGTVPAYGIVRVGHTQSMPAGTYTVTVTEAVGSAVRRTASRVLMIPNQWDFGLNVAIGWTPRIAGQRRQTVSVTPHQATSSCTVSWGDGSPDDTVVNDASVTHDYTLPAPADGYLLKVTETVAEQPRTFARLLGDPTHAGSPVLNARASRSVDMNVAGIAGTSNADWYTLRWGDGTNSPMGAVGSWYPAHHQYTADGDYTVTLDGPCVNDLTAWQRQVTVVTYPSPRITSVAVDPSDPSRKTLLLAVDNTASGGPVTLDWGDGASETVAETSTTAHTYPAYDPYVIIATSQADPTAKDRASVHPKDPGAGTTLTASITADPGDPSRMTAALTAKTSDPNRTSATVLWGDDSEEQPITLNTAAVPHAYGEAGGYGVSVYYPDGKEQVDLDVTVPFPSSMTVARRE